MGSSAPHGANLRWGWLAGVAALLLLGWFGWNAWYAHGNTSTHDRQVLHKPHAQPTPGTTSQGSSDIELKWKFRATGPGYPYGTAATGADGTVYVGAGTHLYALDRNGQQRWMCQLHNGLGQPVIAADGTIFVLSNSNMLHAVTPDGREKWNYSLTATSFYDIVVDTDCIAYIVSSDETIYAIKPDGKLAWQYTATDYLTNGPILGDNGQVAVIDSEAVLHRIDRGGSLAGRHELKIEALENVLRTPQGMYIGRCASGIVAFDASFQQRWLFKLPCDYDYGDIAIRSDGAVFIGGRDGDVIAISAQGRELWRYRAGATVRGAAAIAQDGTLALLDETGEISVLNLDGTLRWKHLLVGAANWKASACWGIDGMLYASGGGELCALGPGGVLAWKQTAGGSFSSDPIIGADGTIYANCEDARLYAVHPDGTLKWQLDCTAYGMASPAMSNDGMIVLSAGKEVKAVDSIGRLVWTYPTNGWASAPAIDKHGRIYFGCDDGSVTALKPTGEKIWAYKAQGAITGSRPVIGRNGAVYIGSAMALTQPEMDYEDPNYIESTYDGQLYALTAAGRMKWSYKCGHVIWSAPVIAASGTVYFTTSVGMSYQKSYESQQELEQGQLFAVSPGGKKMWCYELDGICQGKPTLGLQGEVYVCSWNNPQLGGDGSGHLFAVSPKGNLLWEGPYGSLGSPCVDASGNLYSVGADSKLYALVPGGGELWSYQLGDVAAGAPVIAEDGTIYVGCSDGYLYALQVK